MYPSIRDIFAVSTDGEKNGPKFDEPIPNVTVTVGRDASLPCVVSNLGSYKVSLYFVRHFIRFIYFNKRKNEIIIETVESLKSTTRLAKKVVHF